MEVKQELSMEARMTVLEKKIYHLIRMHLKVISIIEGDYGGLSRRHDDQNTVLTSYNSSTSIIRFSLIFLFILEIFFVHISLGTILVLVCVVFVSLAIKVFMFYLISFIAFS